MRQINFDVTNPEHVKDYETLSQKAFNAFYTPGFITLRKMFPHLVHHKPGEKIIFDRDNPEHMEDFKTLGIFELKKIYSQTTIPLKSDMTKYPNKSTKYKNKVKPIEKPELNNFKWEIPEISYGDMKPMPGIQFGKWMK